MRWGGGFAGLKRADTAHPSASASATTVSMVGLATPCSMR